MVAVDVGGALGAQPGSSEVRISLQERMAASVPVAPRGGRSSENRFHEDADVRVLDVLWDDHGERFRDWRSAVTESTFATRRGWKFREENVRVSGLCSVAVTVAALCFLPSRMRDVMGDLYTQTETHFNSLEVVLVVRRFAEGEFTSPDT